jgi:hypothetical protein
MAMYKDRTKAFSNISPVIISVSILLTWMLFQRFVYVSQNDLQGIAVSTSAIQTLYIPGIWRVSPSQSAIRILMVLIFTLIISGWSLIRRVRQSENFLGKSEFWLELQVYFIILCCTVWYGLFSIGWPRYAYVGLVMSIFLLAKLSYDVVQRIELLLKERGYIRRDYAFFLVILAILSIGALLNLTPLITSPGTNWAQVTGTYIARNLSKESVIESWEWEVDALSDHRNFHHPSQVDLLRATRANFFKDRHYSLTYDMLASEPDYLLLGTMSDWTGIYDDRIIASEFVELEQFGPYRLFIRQ